MSKRTFRFAVLCLLLAGAVFLGFKSWIVPPPPVVPLAKWKVPADTIYQLIFTSDGNTLVGNVRGLAMLSPFNGVVTWDVRDGRMLNAIEVTQRCQIAPNGEFYVRQHYGTGSRKIEDYTYTNVALELDDTRDGQKIGSLPLEESTKHLVQHDDFFISDDSRKLLYLEHSKRTRDGETPTSDWLWDIPQRKVLWRQPRNVKVDSAWQPTGLDGNPFLFDSNNNPCFVVPHVIAPKNIPTDSGDAIQQLHDFPSRRFRFTLEGSEYEYQGFHRKKTFTLVAPQISRDGRFFTEAINSSADNWLKVWDAHTGALIWKYLDDDSDYLEVAVSPDSRTIASGTYDAISLWDAKTGKLKMKLVEVAASSTPQSARQRTTHPHHDHFPTCLAFSPDSKRLAASYIDGTIRIWRVP